MRAIAAARRPAWVRYVPGLILLAAVAVLSGLHATFDVVPPCTDADPCGPAPFAAVSLGLALAAPFAAFASMRTAAGLAGGFLATDVVGQLAAPQAQEQAIWLWALDAGYAALAVLLVGVAAGPLRHGRVETAWASTAVHRTPPAPPRLRRHGTGWRLAAALLFVLAAAIAGLALAAQAGGRAQEEAAHLVAGEVTGHPDEFTVQVRLATGEVTRIDVTTALAHPVGARRGVLVDDAGLHQLVGEPYDTTGWLILAVMAAGLGVALLALAREPGAAVRALFAHAQPATRVYVRFGPGRIAVYAADARPGEPAVLEFDTADTADIADDIAARNDATRAGGWPDDADEDDDEIAMMAARPAVLYGLPAPGQWCAVEAGGQVLAPLRRTRVPVTAPPFTTPPADGAALEVVHPDDVEMPDPATLPPRPEEVAALRDEDRDPDPDLVRTHRRGPAAGYGFAAAAPLAVWGARQWLPDWSFPVWLVLTAPVVALACYGGWRLYLRPRLHWNGAGVSVVGISVAGAAGGARLLPWTAVEVIRLDGDGTVHVEAASDGFVVTAHRGGPLGRLIGRDERSGQQLAAALRLARLRAGERARTGERDVTSLPPAPVVPRAPAALWILGSVELLGYAWLLSAV